MADVLLAMRPEWLELILSGRKTAEFRRVMPKQIKSGDWVYLYCKGYIHGRVRVAGVCYGSSLVLARSFVKEGCIRLEDALVYLHLAKSPGVIKLGEVQRYEYPVRWEGVGHPQNFIYLKGAEQGWVGTEVPCSEDGKDAGRYHAVYNQERDCWDLMFRDVLCASFYVGRYPCAEDKVYAEVSRLNAEHGKEEV